LEVEKPFQMEEYNKI